MTTLYDDTRDTEARILAGLDAEDEAPDPEDDDLDELADLINAIEQNQDIEPSDR